MANEEQLSILIQGVDVWNEWRKQNPSIEIDLRNIDFKKPVDLHGADLHQADLSGVDFTGKVLLSSYPSLPRGANLSRANLWRANLSRANLWAADLSEANLRLANLEGANLRMADIRNADLRMANLADANLRETDLRMATFSEADLRMTNFTRADLRGADFSKANLIGASLIEVSVDKAKISGSLVYGINVWDLIGTFEEQKDLDITHDDQPIITVDNIKVAQFIYLILNNEEIRDVISTLTSKSVLILGRFTIPERKAILDALRNKLREYDLLPIVFDFDRPTDRDFTETIKTLVGMCYFVIADVTNPKSSPLELQATVPDYQIPFVPIIQEGESPFAMMVDLQKKYDWVLDTISYDSLDTLIEILKPLIIDPAIKMRDKLRIIKAAEPTIISGREWKEKKG